MNPVKPNKAKALTFRLEGVDNLKDYLKKTPDLVKKEVAKTMTDIVRLLLNDIKTNFLDGPTGKNTLTTRTGHLKRNIFGSVVITDTKATAKVGTSVNYGKWNHEGATVKAHIIKVKNKKSLAWLKKPGQMNSFQQYAMGQFSQNPKNYKAGGSKLSAAGKKNAKRIGKFGNSSLFNFAKEVHIPTFKIPARPFLLAALQKNKEDMAKLIFTRSQKVLRAVKRGGTK